MARKKQRKPAHKKGKSPKWEAGFLLSLRKTANVAASCEAAAIDRGVVYTRRAKSPEFAAAWDAACEEAADQFEKEADRRATEGVERLKFFRGELIVIPLLDADGNPVMKRIETRSRNGQVKIEEQPVMVPYVERQYSDTLLIFRLKAMRPGKYRENYSHDHSGIPASQHHFYIPEKKAIEDGK